MSITGDLAGFWAKVAPLTYGDDNVVNVSPDIAQIYNQTTVAETMLREFGVIYTSGHKDGELGTVTTLDQLTFLKRAFICEDNHWLCPLDKDSFLYTFYWCKNRKEEAKYILTTMENALEELTQHPQRDWDEYAPKIYALLSKRNYVPKCALDREAYLKLVRARTDNWY